MGQSKEELFMRGGMLQGKSELMEKLAEALELPIIRVPSEEHPNLTEQLSYTFDTRTGWRFEACNDLGGVIRVIPPDRDYWSHELASATAEFIGMFAIHRYPDLKSFRGFDNLRFEIEKSA